MITLLAIINLLMYAAQASIYEKNVDPAKCKLQVAKCEPLERSTCMGAPLPYGTTSVALAGDSNNQSEVADRLIQWSGLRYVPKCWEVVQPLLCSIYMPKCNDTEKSIELPGVDICEATRGPCRIVAETQGWPSFLLCNQSHFVPGCGTSAVDLPFNKTGQCSRPLIATDNKDSWFAQAEGCGIQCQNPLFTDEQHEQMHLFVAIMGSLCMACTLFTVLTFLIDWRNANRYPALILFFINFCFFVGSVGWMAQFFPGIPGARTDIVCKKDGTQRRSEPQIGAGENIYCTLVFILVYYFMIAGITWFVILAYAWNVTFRAFGTARETLENQKSLFHIAAWSIPLVLTVICLAMTKIDGDSMSGICFVGYYDHVFRGLFVLLPVGLVLVVGLIFLMFGLVTLWKLQCSSPGLLSDKASARIRETLIRLGLFASADLIFVTITFVVHVYIFANEQGWKTSFEDFILCEAKIEGEQLIGSKTHTKTNCELESTPSLVAMQIHVFAFFGAGIVMSSWVWNKSTLYAWKRFFKRVIGPSTEQKPVKLRKHEVIAQAFQKRRQIQAGRLSLSFASTHDDPLGMKFDVNSISSQEMTSVWASALPRMVMRRGALVYPAMMGRRYSDSDIESVKSVSSLQQKLAQLQKDAHLYNSHHSCRRHSESQNSQSDKSDRSKRKKRRHIKRGRNRSVIPSSSPSVPDTVPSQSKEEPPQRRGSLNSNGTNQSLTNTQSSVTTGNQRFNTSDEDRGFTPDIKKEKKKIEPGSLPGNLPTGKVKGKHRKRDTVVAHPKPNTVDYMNDERDIHAVNTNGDNDDLDDVFHGNEVPLNTHVDSEEEEKFYSSDEERVTPEMHRPPMPTAASMSDSPEVEDIRSSDEDRATPVEHRPHLIMMVAPMRKALAVQVVKPQPQKQPHIISEEPLLWNEDYNEDEDDDEIEQESLHSSDEARATPEDSRPQYARDSDVEKGEEVRLSSKQKSLLDRVLELQDSDEDSDELDHEVAEIIEELKEKRRKKMRAKLMQNYYVDNETFNNTTNDGSRSAKKTPEKFLSSTPKSANNNISNSKPSSQQFYKKDDAIPKLSAPPKVCNNGNCKNKNKSREHYQSNPTNADAYNDETWSPESSIDPGRSVSPVMSPFKKVSDWMDMVPTGNNSMTPSSSTHEQSIPLIPMKNPKQQHETDLNAEISKCILGHTFDSSSEPSIVVPKIKISHKKRSSGSNKKE